MTESEAIARFKSCQENAGNCEMCRFYSCCGIYDMEDLAIEALKEVQEYRKIGTPEECRAAMEKQRRKIVKNPYGTSYIWKAGYCPVCGCGVTARWDYCQCCGQKLSWENHDVTK